MDMSPKRVIALFFYAVILLIVIWFAISNKDKPIYKNLPLKVSNTEQKKNALPERIPVSANEKVLEDY